jgi:hypothetical protein
VPAVVFLLREAIRPNIECKAAISKFTSFSVNEWVHKITVLWVLFQNPSSIIQKTNPRGINKSVIFNGTIFTYLFKSESKRCHIKCIWVNTSKDLLANLKDSVGLKVLVIALRLNCLFEVQSEE